MEKLKSGKVNLIAGWLFVLLFFLLGWYLDAKIKQNAFSESLRLYLRRIHTHGLAFAMLNVLVGLCVDQSGLGKGAKRTASLTAILGGILFPVGLFCRLCQNSVHSGVVAGVLIHTGAILMALSTLLLLIGFVTLPKETS